MRKSVHGRKCNQCIRRCKCRHGVHIVLRCVCLSVEGGMPSVCLPKATCQQASVYMHTYTHTHIHCTRAYLSVEGSLPSDHRSAIWKLLLRVPNNDRAFAELASARGLYSHLSEHGESMKVVGVTGELWDVTDGLLDDEFARRLRFAVDALRAWSPPVACWYAHI